MFGVITLPDYLVLDHDWGGRFRNTKQTRQTVKQLSSRQRERITPLSAVLPPLYKVSAGLTCSFTELFGESDKGVKLGQLGGG